MLGNLRDETSYKMANASVRYMVHDVDAVLPFYIGALGFHLKERMGPAIAMVTYGDLTLWLSGPTLAAFPGTFTRTARLSGKPLDCSRSS